MANFHREKTEQSCFCFDFTRRQEQGKCTKQKQRRQTEETTMLYFSFNLQILPIIFLILFSTIIPAISAAQFDNFRRLNQTFRPGEESKKMRLIKTHLMKINKPAVKTIQVTIYVMSLNTHFHLLIITHKFTTNFPPLFFNALPI